MVGVCVCVVVVGGRGGPEDRGGLLVTELVVSIPPGGGGLHARLRAHHTVVGTGGTVGSQGRGEMEEVVMVLFVMGRAVGGERWRGDP